jgi:hypothetical protein
MNNTKIYLVENCYGDPNKVYIGKTKNSRELPHKITYGEQIIYNYIDEVNSLDRKDWEPLESYWIEQFRQWGYEVINKNKKGGGGPEFVTDETKNKMSKFKSGKKHDKIHSNKGRPNIKLRKPKPEGFGDMMRQSRIGKPKPDGMGNKVSLSLKGKPKEGAYKPVLQYNLDGKIIKEWPSINHAAESTNSSASTISKVCRGIFKQTNGFIWKYKKQTI